MSSSIVAAAFGAAFVLIAAIYSLRFIYDCRVEGRAIEIVLFRVLSIYRIPLADIDAIRKVPRREIGVGNFVLRLGNRLTNECILIQKRSGWFRRVAITPHDADRFMDEAAAAREARSE